MFSIFCWLQLACASTNLMYKYRSRTALQQMSFGNSLPFTIVLAVGSVREVILQACTLSTFDKHLQT